METFQDKFSQLWNKFCPILLKKTYAWVQNSLKPNTLTFFAIQKIKRLKDERNLFLDKENGKISFFLLLAVYIKSGVKL